MRGGIVRVAVREILARVGPSVSLATAVLIGVTGFTVLTTSSEARRLETVGEVDTASRQAFDILVRPKDSRLPVERSDGLIEPGYLTGLTGISVGQWHRIENLPDVELAAPVAVVGFVTPFVETTVDVTPYASRRHASTFRVDASWRLPDGSRIDSQPRYTVSTPQALGVQDANGSGVVRQCGPPLGPIPPGSTVTSVPASVWCHTERSDGPEVPGSGVPDDHVADYIPIPFPMLVAAVDPETESRMFDLGDAVDGAGLSRLARLSGRDNDKIPALLSAASPVEAKLRLKVSRLSKGATHEIFNGSDLKSLRDLAGEPLFSKTVTADGAYRSLKERLRHYREGPGYEGRIAQYWSVSNPTLRPDRYGRLHAAPVDNDLTQLWRDGSDFSVAPAGTDDVSFREILLHYRYSPEGGTPNAPAIVAAGSYDPSRLVDRDDVTSQILSGFSSAPTQRQNGLPLDSSTNIASLVQPPPQMLIDLASLPKLTGPWQPSTSSAPLSAIRVRVKGVSGVDDLSRERVRLAAQRIREETGLDVDVTVGSSTTIKALVVPKGRYGRPEQRLDQTWVKLGVATAILEALDKKSLILLLLVLLVSVITVSNSAIASIRSRRTHLGVMACLGWSRWSLFRLVVVELSLIAVVAGGLGVMLSLLLGSLSGANVPLARAVLALPSAFVVTTLAGLGPALSAMRSSPLEAVHPSVSGLRRIRQARTLAALARLNLRRVPSRALLAILGLAVATLTFTLLLAITLGFQGATVGSVLGDAAAVEARGPDYAAAFATLVLAGLGMINLTYLNIRERSVEMATLQSVGWSNRSLAGLLVRENALVGIIGGVVGAGLGYGLAALLFGSLPSIVVAGAAGAAAMSTCTAVLAALASSRLLHRISLTTLLTE